MDKKFPVAEKNNAGSNKQTNNNRTIWPKGKKILCNYNYELIRSIWSTISYFDYNYFLKLYHFKYEELRIIRMYFLDETIDINLSFVWQSSG